MPKGVPWTNEETTRLRQLLQEGVGTQAIALALGKTEDAVYNKIKRLGLVEGDTSSCSPSSSEITLPAELPTSEEALQMLASALQTVTKPGLSRTEVARLQVLANLSRAYDHLLANYIHYREIETKLVELDHKYVQLAQKIQGNAPPTDNTQTPQPPTQ